MLSKSKSFISTYFTCLVRSSSTTEYQLLPAEQSSGCCEMQGDYEDILVQAGGFGRYQIFVYFWYLFVCWTMAMNNTFMYFGAILPKEYCPNSTKSYTSYDFSDYHQIETNRSSNCTLFYKFKSVSVEWNLYGPREYIIAMITSIQMFGSFCGSIISGQLSDKWGRKPVFICGYVAMVTTRFLSGFMTNWVAYAGLIFLVGFSFSTVWGTFMILFVEVLVARWRLITYFLAWPLGFIILGICGKLFEDYRQLSFAICFPAPMVLTMMFWIYESPKWLLQTNQSAKAKKIMTKIAKRNGIKPSRAESVVNEAFKMTADGIVSSKRNLSYWHLFYDRTASTRFLTLVFSYFINGTIFMGLILDSGNLTQDPAVAFIVMMVIRMFINSSMPFIDRFIPSFGRKKLLMSGTCIVLFCLIFSALIQLSPVMHKYPPILISSTSILGIMFAGFIWAALDMLSMELLPTELRTMGFNVCTIASVGGSAICPQINLLKTVWGPLPYLIYPILMVPCLLVDWLILPETKGCALPDFPGIVKDDETDPRFHCN